MSSPDQAIHVRSHVGRDLLQTAALFKTDRAVVGEYVANAMEYVDEGVAPIVSVELDGRKRRIQIADNGRGMDRDGLINFFLMHGENQDRKVGRGRRGMFGTGKAAAFGIGEVLRISTVCKGFRWVVELHRSDVKAMDSEAPIPVRELEKGVRVSASNGTTVTIEGIQLRTLDHAGIIRHIERNLAGWSRAAQIYVNDHKCEFREPSASEVVAFAPSPSDYPLLQGCELLVKISPIPLEQDEQGVAVTSAGVLYVRSLGGNEGRPMADLIFGQLEVASLQHDKSPIPAFDQSRNLSLNPENPLAFEILNFVGASVDRVRRELVRREKLRKATDVARAWEARAREIEDVINDDLRELRNEIAKARTTRRGPVSSTGSEAGEDTEIVVPEGEGRADEEPARDRGGEGGARSETVEPAEEAKPPLLHSDPDGTKPADKRAGGGEKGAGRGGFSVEFREMGAGESRAVFRRDARAILVNLDHPQLVAARGAASDPHLVLRRLSYEIAFTEYAIAVASELAAQDEYFDVSEPIVDVRRTINRLATRAAHLYAPSGDSEV